MKSFLLVAGATFILNIGVQQHSWAQKTQQNPITQEEQKQKDPAIVAAKHSAMMQEKLGLTNDQTSKIKNILYESLNSKEKATDAEKKEIRKKSNDEILKVLTPDQQKKYIEMKEEQKKKKIEEGNKDNSKTEKSKETKSK